MCVSGAQNSSFVLAPPRSVVHVLCAVLVQVQRSRLGEAVPQTPHAGHFGKWVPGSRQDLASLPSPRPTSSQMESVATCTSELPPASRHLRLVLLRPRPTFSECHLVAHGATTRKHPSSRLGRAYILALFGSSVTKLNTSFNQRRISHLCANPATVILNHATLCAIHAKMEEQPQNQLFSTFPNPPVFLWQEFTPEKVARIADAKKAWGAQNPESASSKAVTLIPDLPEDLEFLQPPPEPSDGSWKALGGVWTVRLAPTLLERNTAPWTNHFLPS